MYGHIRFRDLPGDPRQLYVEDLDNLSRIAHVGPLDSQRQA